MKLLVTGPESTGKSTISEQLSEHYNWIMIPEYARTYLEKNGAVYNANDIVKIAKHHYNLYLKYETTEAPRIFDTYLLNLKIWYEVKYGIKQPWISKKLEETSFNCILLMKPDLPWEAGPFRESEFSRDFLFQKYLDELSYLNWEFHIIDGAEEIRYRKAIEVIDLYKSTKSPLK